MAVLNLDMDLVFSFGDFVFDSRNGDLSKNGMRVRMNKQTAELLAVMLANAGTLVTRSQIKEALWPGHQISYEKAISNSMGKLRCIFRDDARNPQYIECIPKRGYRLVAEVRQIVHPAPAAQTAPMTAQASLSRETVGHAAPTATDLEVFAPVRESGPLAVGAWPPTRTVLKTYRWRTLVFALSAAVVFAAYSLPRMSRKVPVPPVKALAAEAPVSLGIVPFETNSPEAEELGSSFRLDLTDALSQLPQIRMLAANSTGNLKRNAADLPQEAAKLHLDAILFGKLAVDAKGFHLQLELVRGNDATHLATLQYSGTKDEMVSIRDKIQQQIFSKLQLPAANRPGTADTNNPQAYQAYLSGRYHYQLQTDDSLRQAVNDFSAAVDRDPQFARAYAALGRTYLVMGNHDIVPREESFRNASQAIDRAQFLNPTLPDVHASRGLILLVKDWNVAAAEQEMQQAIQLDPNQALYHQWMARVLVQRGQVARAQDEIQIAHRDDPYSIPVLITEIYIDDNTRQYPQELATAYKLKALMHNAPLAMDDLGDALWSNGQYEAAILEWHQMAVADKDMVRAEMEDRGLKAFKQGGKKAYALVRLDAIQSKTFKKLRPNDFSPVEWNVDAGRDKEALAALRAQFISHDPGFLSSIASPSLDPLRRYDEYKEIVADSHLQ